MTTNISKNRLKKYLITPSVFCLFFVFTACEKALIESDPPNTPLSNFNYLWQTINDKYTFLDYKKVNWDSVKNVWQPRVKDTTNDIVLFRIMDSMLYNLKDGHVNLSASFNFSRNWQWYLNYPDNYNENLVERNYLQGLQWYTGALTNRFLDSNRIGYIRYESFSNTVSDFDIDLCMARFQNTKGLIIDVRSNGGGAVSNVAQLASRFTDKRFLAYKEAQKNGSGKNDLSTFKETYIDPKGTIKYLKPVIILTNRRCYSATTLFACSMSNLPNVRILGDWTGGGGGLPTSSQLPNGWVVRYSSTVTMRPDGLNIENGVPTNIRQDISKDDETKGIDSIIERALKELK